MPPKGKKAKGTYKMCESLQESILVQKWQREGFEDKELMALLTEFKKTAKDRKPNKKEQKQGISDVGGGGNDLVSKDEFAKLFKKKFKASLTDANKLFAQADADRSGFVNIDEFICLMAIIKKDDPEKKIALAFKMYDTQCDGRLNKDEISTMLSLMLTIEDEDAKAKQIEDMLAKMLASADANSDGKLTLDELTAAMKTEGFLDLLGQNVTINQAAGAMLNTSITKKSSLCLVM